MTPSQDEALLDAIREAGFEPMGWFKPDPEDGVPEVRTDVSTRCCLLIGNAGPAMFDRFSRERPKSHDALDDWTRHVLAPLADALGARAIYPFDKPALPFLTWARKGGGGHTSPLGLNIHPEFGLWHAYRAAFLFPRRLSLPASQPGAHPCDSCAARPCLDACPIGAFSPGRYDVARCRAHVSSSIGQDCASGGCRARIACPVGASYRYASAQIEFHMSAFADID